VPSREKKKKEDERRAFRRIRHPENKGVAGLIVLILGEKKKREGNN